MAAADLAEPEPLPRDRFLPPRLRLIVPHTGSTDARGVTLAGVLVLAAFVALAASCGSAPAETRSTVVIALPDTEHAHPPSPAADDAGEPPEEDAGPRCVPAIGRTCPPVRGTPSIVLDPDLTPTDGGFPAVSRGGDLLAVARIDPDGARGAPNLAIVILRASDGGEVHRFAILSADEAIRVEEEGESALADVVRGRVRVAQAELAHGHYESLDGIDFASRDHRSLGADGRGLHLAFDASARTIVVSDATGERGRASVPAGASPDGAWTDPARHFLVLHTASPAADLVVPLHDHPL